MQKEIIFKKNIFGGFNRRQVIDCLSQLKSDCAARISPEELRNMQELIDNYQHEINEKDNEITNLKQQLQDLNYSCTASKTLFEAKRTVTEAKNRAHKINTKLKNNVEDRSNRIEDIFEKIEKVNSEIDRIKNSLLSADLKLDNISINNLEAKRSEVNVSKPQETVPVVDDNNEVTEVSKVSKVSEVSEVTEATEEVLSSERKSEVISEDISATEETINSIDNFFTELYKMTNGKLFEPRKMPEKASDSPDDFEYEY